MEMSDSLFDAFADESLFAAFADDNVICYGDGAFTVIFCGEEQSERFETSGEASEFLDSLMYGPE